MSTILGTPYPQKWEGRPPRMSSEDLTIWLRYRTEAIKKALNIYFDVGLGGQTEVPPGTSPEMALMWFRNTQKRVDVIVEEPERWVIIELRPHAQSSAIGRLLQYFDLWKEDPPDSRMVDLRLVTDTVDQDTKKLAEKLGITFVVV